MLRHIALITIVLALLLLLGCGPAARNRDQLTWTAEEVFANPWTQAELTTWRQEIDLNGTPPTYSEVGAYPLGNSRVFGIVGLTLPLGTVSDTLGPTYQKITGLMGSYLPVVLVRGKPVVPPIQSTAWVAPGGVVHSRWEDSRGLQVDLLQTVPPDLDAIVTVIVVSNKGTAALRDLALGLATNVPVTAEDGGLYGERGSVRVRLGFAGARTDTVALDPTTALPPGLEERLLPLGRMTEGSRAPTILRCRLGTLASGRSVAKIAYVTVSRDQAEEAAAIEDIHQRGLGIFEDAHRWWQEWADRTLTIEGLPQQLGELLTIGKYLCRVQQADTGGYSPMHKYTYRWIRDANGPILHLLDAGDFDSVARDLRYHYVGCALQREVGNNLPLNLQMIEPGAIDWSAVKTPKAEIASFVILQNYWYWLHTGQSEQLAQRWGYLRACLDGQEIDEQGRLPFHGDETYRFPGYSLHEAGKTEEVSDYLHLHLRSADSAFEYVAAAEALAQMAAAAGHADEAPALRAAARRVREATERHYWQRDRGYYAPAMSDLSGERYRYPFANINLRPTWIGYADGDDRQQRENVVNALKWLYRPDSHTARLTPGCGYTVGMTPGMVLSALTAIDHPAAEEALQGLLLSAEPSGGFAEMNRPDDTPSRDVWGLHRARPWEGGINCSAVVQFLLGFRPNAPERRVSFAPHLPAGCSEMTARNIRVAEAVLTLRVVRTADLITATVRLEQGKQPLEVDLTVAPLGGREQAGHVRETLDPGAGRTEVKASAPVPAPGEEAATLPVAQEPFDYGEADIDGGEALLLTWSAEVLQQVRAIYPSVKVIDTRISWPASYLRSALLTRSGRPRFERVITDVAGFPGGFKPNNYWTEGAGAEVLREFRSAGGVVEEAKVPAAGQAPSQELIN